MDTNQANQVIAWLEEEHRRDRALLTELRQRVESQAVEITNQSKRVSELESRLSATQARLSYFTTLEQSIQQAKDELTLMVREQESTLGRYQRDQSKARHLDQESTGRALNEFKRSLEVIPPLQERLLILKNEDQRLGELVMGLQSRVTAHERQTQQVPDRITYLENQRGGDTKAVAQLQEEVVQLLRRTEALAGRQELIDDLSRKNEQRIGGVAGFRDELVKRQMELAEDVKLRHAQSDRQNQDWQALLVRFEEEMSQHRRQLEQIGRQRDEVSQHLVSLDEFKAVLNREQNHVNEVQRLSEERQRRELTEWQAANEQRWTKMELEREARWNQQAGRNEEAVTRLRSLEELRTADVERVQKLAKDIAAVQAEYRAKLKELWKVHERDAIFQLDQVRRWYDEISMVVADHTDE